MEKTQIVKLWEKKPGDLRGRYITLIMGYQSPEKEKPVILGKPELWFKPNSESIKKLIEKLENAAKTESSKIPIIQPLRLLEKPIIGTREDNGEFARRVYTYTKRGKAKKRLSAGSEIEIPGIETFKPDKNLIYKFIFGYGKKTLTKIVKSTFKRNRKTPYQLIDFNHVKTLKINYILRKLIVYQKDDRQIGLILYENKLKPEYRPGIRKKHIKRVKVRPITRLTVDYSRLAKYEKRLSKKWFNELLSALKTREKPVNPIIEKKYLKCLIRCPI